MVYTNDGLPQSEFELCATLKKQPIKWSSHNIDDPISDHDDAQLVKAVITGKRDDGIFDNATISNSNRLKTVSQPYTYAISESDIPGHFANLKFGTRTSVTANTESTVWEGATAKYPYMTTAQQLQVKSSSAADAAGGIGIRTLTLEGLDAAYAVASETITLTGVTPVTTTNSYIRIFRAYGATSGTSATNVGKITVYNNAGTVEQLVINIGDGQTLMTLWTVPAGQTAHIIQATASSDSNKGSTVSLVTRQIDGGTSYPWRIRYRAYLFSGSNLFPFGIPFLIPEKTDIEVRVLTPASAGTTSFGATFEFWYEDND